MKHRLFLFAAGLTVGLTCSFSAAQTKPTTIRFWSHQVSQAPSLQKEIALFEKQNPGIKVELTTTAGAQYTQTFDLAHKSNNAPDIFTLGFNLPGGFNQVLQNGWAAPLNKYATRAWKASFPSGSFVEGVNVRDGQVYTAPWDLYQAANRYPLFINNDVFRAAGLVDSDGKVLIPKSWNDVRKYARKIVETSKGARYGWGFGAKQGDFAITLQARSVPLSGATCGNNAPLDCFNYKTARYEFNTNPAWAAWFDHWIGMKEDGSILPQSGVIDDEQARVLFAEGRFGMLVSGPYVVNGWKRTNPDFNDYTVTTLPTRTGVQSTSVYSSLPQPTGSQLAISSQSKNQEAAWKLFAFLNSKESAMRWAGYGEGARVWRDSVQELPGKAADVAKVTLRGVKSAPNFFALRPQLADVKLTQPTVNLSYLILAAFNGQLTRAQVPAALTRLNNDLDAALDKAIEDARKGGSKVTRADFSFPNWNPQSNQTTVR